MRRCVVFLSPSPWWIELGRKQILGFLVLYMKCLSVVSEKASVTLFTGNIKENQWYLANCGMPLIDWYECDTISIHVIFFFSIIFENLLKHSDQRGNRADFLFSYPLMCNTHTHPRPHTHTHKELLNCKGKSTKLPTHEIVTMYLHYFILSS